MKKFIVIIFLLKSFNVTAQFEKLKGTWVTNEQEILFINDTSHLRNGNLIENSNFQSVSLLVNFFKDTISFQSEYTSSKTNFKIQYTDRYDLKIKKMTDTLLVVEPVSDFAKKFFSNKNVLTFKRQKYNVDNSLVFEKIIFHTTECYGRCNVYHLLIDSSKEFKLNSEVVYTEKSYNKDTLGQGYFVGKLNDSLYNNLIEAIKTSGIKNLRMRDAECCDGVVITLIIYFNGQRKYFKTMITPFIVYNLIRTLYNICDKHDGQKIQTQFKIEN